MKATLPDGTVLEGEPDEVGAVLARLGRRVDTGNTRSMASVREAMCRLSEIEEEELVSATRARRVSHPRMVAMYYCRHALNASFAEIGDEFGGRDHTTAMSAAKRVQNLIDTKDEPTLRLLRQLREAMEG